MRQRSAAVAPPCDGNATPWRHTRDGDATPVRHTQDATRNARGGHIADTLHRSASGASVKRHGNDSAAFEDRSVKERPQDGRDGLSKIFQH